MNDHPRQTKTRAPLWRIGAAALLVAAPDAARSDTNDRDWPSVEVTPVLDVPMRDTAITRGPDGMFYLTGTLGQKVSGVRVQVSGKISESGTLEPRTLNPDAAFDFDNIRQIKLWKSADLKTWQDVGVVFDLENPKGHFERGIRWLRQSHKDPSRADSPVCWGVKAPELHHVKGEWYICFSINDQGSGLLKSTSGKAEGPYESYAQITLRHGDPTLFWDRKDEFGGDDSVYWLFGGGWIAKMNDDLSALAEQPRLLTTGHQRPPDWAVKGKGAEVFRDYPLTVGDHGAFLFKNRGRYYLTAAERTNRMNASCDDTFIAWADAPTGPYSEKFLMVPHGGGVTVFQGPRSSAVPKHYYPQPAFFLRSVSKNAKQPEEIEKARGDDTFYATFFGHDGRAIFRDRPGFLPLEWTGPEREVEQLFQDCESFPRKPKCVVTERGPWKWMVPLLPDENVRDIKVCVGPDEYYFSGAAISHPGKLMVWRSKDLARWEEVGPIWTYEQVEWMDKKLPYGPKDRTDFSHVLWHSWITRWNNTYYVTFCIFGDSPGMRGTTALKSASGKIEGPWVSLGRIGGQFGHDPGPNGFFFFELDGALHASDWHQWKNAVAEADLDAPGWKWKWNFIEGSTLYDQMQRGDCYSVNAIENVPLLSFHSGGKLDGKERQDCTTYDHNFVVMKTITGPPIGRPFCVPHVMASNLFKDRKGYWWSSMFGSDPTAPWDCRFGLVALRVEKRGDRDLFIDVEASPDEYQRTIMGGGRIAEVRTVVETMGDAK